jgi:hypothetical protein
VRTRLPDLPRQVRTTYFRHEFDVDLADRPSLQFRTWADDGVVVFVNGVEVGRERVSADKATIRHTWIWSTGAPRTQVALAEDLTLEIDPELLVDGRNVISAALIPNWRTSFDVTFGGQLVVAEVGVPTQPVEPSDPTIPVDSPLPHGDLVASGQRWEYRRAEGGPMPTWKYVVSSLGWSAGRAPFGLGRATEVATTLLSPGARPLSTYFRHVFTIGETDEALSLGARVTTWADDGVIVYVNGHELGRHRVRQDIAGAHAETWATGAPSWQAAQAELVSFAVPESYLLPGSNVVAVQVVSDHRGTPDISFDAIVGRSRGLGAGVV